MSNDERRRLLDVLRQDMQGVQKIAQRIEKLDWENARAPLGHALHYLAATLMDVMSFEKARLDDAGAGEKP